MQKDNEKKGPQEGAKVPEEIKGFKGVEEGLPEGMRSRYGASVTVKIGVKPGFVLRKVGQAYMVMPAGPRMKEYQGMITLNETGAFLFKESEKEEPTRQKLIDACKAEYGATDEEAEMAVASFVEQCGRCGLFETEVQIYDKVLKRVVTQEEVDAAE